MYGPYVRAVRTGHPYLRPVYTGALFNTRTYGPCVRVSKNEPVHTGRKYDGTYIRAVFTSSAYRP